MIHQITQTEEFKNKHNYQDFINWVSAEFDLFLQDNNNDLNIFYPEGYLSIKNVSNINNKIVAEIDIQCNNEDGLQKLFKQVQSVITVFRKHRTKLIS